MAYIKNKIDFIEACIAASNILEEYIIFSTAKDKVKLKQLNQLDVYRSKLFYMLDNHDTRYINNSKYKKYKRGEDPYE